MKRKIITGSDNKILRTKSVEIKKTEIGGKKLSKLIKDMKDTFDSGDLGLAAPQVGDNVRMALARLNPSTENEVTIVMINPVITFKGEDKEWAEEGCLSLPDIWLDVERFKKLTVKYLNQKGQEIVLNLEKLNARIVQHEVDHLDAILICDKGVPILKKEK